MARGDRPAAPAAGDVEGGGKIAHGASLEHLPYWKFYGQAGIDARGQSGSEKGVSAEVEEVILWADGGGTEEVGEDRHNDPLGVCFRTADAVPTTAAGGGRAAWSSLPCGVRGSSSSTV